MRFGSEVTHVSNLCERLKVNSTLFNYRYNGSIVRGIYFMDSQSLLLGIDKFNVSWFLQFDEELSVLAKVPNDIYKNIKSYFYNHEKNKYETQAFYQNLRTTLGKLTLSQIARPVNEEIKKLIKTTRTRDKTYDDEGDKPFFSHWRRQSEGMYPSKHNLDKTERYFGKRIRNICRERRISSVWTTEESEHCLDFMNLNKVEKDLLK